MPEQIQAILNRLLEWWRKFTKRQQVLIVSITAVVLVSFIILAIVITRPTMVQLVVCEDGTQAAAVKELLEEEKDKIISEAVADVVKNLHRTKQIKEMLEQSV